MADKEKEQAKETKEGAAAPPKKGINKMLLIIIAAGVLVVGGGAGGFLFLKGKATAGGHGDKDEVASAEEHGDDGHGAKEEHGKESKDSKHGAKGAAEGAFIKLDPFIVNLQDNSGTRYLKVTLDLEVNSPAAGAELTANNTKIRDSLIILLSSKNYTDIGTVEGKYQLRDEIVTRINQFLAKNKVKTAYFTEFVIQ